jgi:hypothetical protein
MQKNDVKMAFTGFEPTHDARSSLYYFVNKLNLKTPSQSIMSATFTLTNGLFEGVIKISSTAENIVVKATDVHLVELSQKLMDKVGEKLEKWRSLRFD